MQISADNKQRARRLFVAFTRRVSHLLCLDFCTPRRTRRSISIRANAACRRYRGDARRQCGSCARSREYAAFPYDKCKQKIAATARRQSQNRFLKNNAGFVLIVLVAATFAIFGCVTTIGFFCLLGCFREMRAAALEARVSHRTLVLYRRMTTLLLIDIANAAIFIMLPSSIVFILSIFGGQYGWLLYKISLAIGEYYPLCANITIIFYIKPYRQRLLEFWKFICPSSIRNSQLTSLIMSRLTGSHAQSTIDITIY